MFKKILLAAALAVSPFAISACDAGGGAGGMTVPDKALKPGGVFVAYVLGCEQGCDQLKRGDLIQQVDGAPVKTRDELLAKNLTDGAEHKLTVYRGGETMEVALKASPNNSQPPIKDAPPFWTVGAENLMQTPSGWARRRMFGHASPQIVLRGTEGDELNGRKMYGKKHFIVYFDWQLAKDMAYASTYLKVIQKAQDDLKSKGFELVFAQLKFPGRDSKPAMNDTDLRKFASDNQLKPEDGGPKPLPPLYRFPNATEYNETQFLGMEGAYTTQEALGEAPAIVILDEGGIVRWHSEGVIDDPGGEMPADVYTIVTAVEFARDSI